VVVCGSVVKETIIPGWSDLDLIFLIEGFEKLDSLYQVRDALLRAKCDTEIGIGVDTVFHDEFRKTRKLGGRPLAMTFEVAGYGQTWYGKNPFAGLEFDSEAQQRVANEKVIAILAEIHNWRRSFLTISFEEIQSSEQWLARCVKLCLKLLKHETDANVHGPYTYEAALHRLRAHYPAHKGLLMFETAVGVRREWLNVVGHQPAIREALSFLNNHLAEYYIPSRTVETPWLV
jgi:hypothetical protein